MKIEPSEDDRREYKAVKRYRLTEKKRVSNRKAQAAWYKRQRAQRGKQTESAEQSAEDAAAEVAEAWASFAKEQAAFAAERQTWLSSTSSDSLKLQAWVAPSAAGLRVSSEDSFLVAVKKLGLPAVVLDVIYSVACQSFSMCGYPLPNKDEVDMWAAHEGTFLVRTHIPGIARLLEDAENKNCCRSLNRVMDLMSSIMIMMKLVGATDRSTGGDLARIMLRVIGQLPYEQHGQPEALHWHKAAARAQLSPEQRRHLLALQEHYHERLCSIRQQAAELPRSLHSFLQADKGPSSAASCSALDQGDDSEVLLAALLKEEHAAASEFYFAFRSQVLTGLQNGRLYVASHPYQPDMDAICTVLRGWDSYPELPVGAHQQPCSCTIEEQEPARTTSTPLLVTTSLTRKYPSNTSCSQEDLLTLRSASDPNLSAAGNPATLGTAKEAFTCLLHEADIGAPAPSSACGPQMSGPGTRQPTSFKRLPMTENAQNAFIGSFYASNLDDLLVQFH